MTKTKTKPYKVILEVNDIKIKTEGETLLDAFNLLEVNDIRTWSNIIARKGELEAEHRFNSIVKLKRFLDNKTIKIITAKNMELFFK